MSDEDGRRPVRRRRLEWLLGSFGWSRPLEYRWIVVRDGRDIALLTDPRHADMFWVQARLTPLPDGDDHPLHDDDFWADCAFHLRHATEDDIEAHSVIIRAGESLRPDVSVRGSFARWPVPRRYTMRAEERALEEARAARRRIGQAFCCQSACILLAAALVSLLADRLTISATLLGVSSCLLVLESLFTGPARDHHRLRDEAAIAATVLWVILAITLLR